MTKETLEVLKSLGTWFDFSVLQVEGEVYLRGRQWFHWNGNEWKFVPTTKLPKELLEMINA